MNNKSLSIEDLNYIKSSRSVRRKLAKESHYWFFSIYLSHYIGYAFAPFHHKMFGITQDESITFVTLMAFRGSGKSTIMTLSYPIWSIVGTQEKKFVLIVSQTQNQARLHLTNLKRELEGNELLKDDIGPFQEVNDEWGANSIVISNYNARITAVSTEQSIRGMRHEQYRPDLIICDDIEDLSSTKTKEGRDRTFSWFNGEIIPVGDRSTKIIVVGNLLHEDCLIMKLQRLINEYKLTGHSFAFPLVDKESSPLWKDKFKTPKDVENIKKSIASESAYYREYLLKIISDDDRLVNRDWLKYYDVLPLTSCGNYHYTATGIDLAISEKDSADCTAMVSAMVFGENENLKVYILPYPVNSRMSFPKTVETATNLSKNLGSGQYTELFIEDVGYQRSLIQHLNTLNVPTKGVKVSGQDKRSRLALITHLVQQGKVLFPKTGVDELINQLTGFGIEKHDDLADAFSLLLTKIMEKDTHSGPFIRFLGDDDDIDGKNVIRWGEGWIK